MHNFTLLQIYRGLVPLSKVLQWRRAWRRSAWIGERDRKESRGKHHILLVTDLSKVCLTESVQAGKQSCTSAGDRCW